MPTERAPETLAVDQLERLIELCAEKGAPVVSRLNPGLTNREMDELTAKVEIRLPEEAKTWWRWHNGSHGPGDRSIVRPDFVLLTLEECVRICVERREIAASLDADQPAESWWGTAWFPWTFYGNVAIDCDVADGAPSPIRSVNYHFEPQTEGRIVARSMGEVVSWWIEGLERDAYEWSPQFNSWSVVLNPGETWPERVPFV